jgi:hypothetical protein
MIDNDGTQIAAFQAVGSGRMTVAPAFLKLLALPDARHPRFSQTRNSDLRAYPRKNRKPANSATREFACGTRSLSAPIISLT